MNMHDDRTADCAALQELVAWYPTKALSDEERRRLEAHLKICPRCSELAAFALRLRGDLAKGVEHPEPDDLVAFAEDDPRQTEAARRRVQEHAARCAACDELLRVLMKVGDDLLLEPAAAIAGSNGSRRPQHRGRLAPWRWSAAAVAAAAVLAVVLLTREQPAPRIDGVHIVAGGGTGVRNGTTVAADVVKLAAGSQQIVILEFTDLATPPRSEAYFRVLIAGAAGSSIWHKDVRGELFLENYTLALVVPAGALAPGRYSLDVTAPDGASILRSRLEVE
jgi:hypothetical protein